MSRLDFRRWGRDHREADAVPVPYLDIFGEDTPIEFLFRYKGEHLFIARGNLQTCKGREKTGKSAVGIMLIVAALGGGFLDIQPQQGDTVVLWIDTEQDRNTLRERAKAALEMAGEASDIDRLQIVTLKAIAPSQRLETAISAIGETAPDFVFLDGAADLCEDWNNNVEAAKVVDALLKATDEANCAMLCVIHTNKKDDEARGHLGTILQQKSSEVYEVSKEGDIANIRQKLCRFASTPDLDFKFGDGFMIEAARGGLSKAEAKRQQMQTIFTRLFDGVQEYRYKDLVAAYKEQEAKSDRSAKEAVKAAVEADIIYKNGVGTNTRYTLLFPSLNDEADSLLDDADKDCTDEI